MPHNYYFPLETCTATILQPHVFPSKLLLPLFSATLSLTFFSYLGHFLSFIHFCIISSLSFVSFFPFSSFIFRVWHKAHRLSFSLLVPISSSITFSSNTWEEREKFGKEFSFILRYLFFFMSFLHPRRLAACPGEVVRAASVLWFGVPGTGTRHQGMQCRVVADNATYIFHYPNMKRKLRLP